MAGTAKDPFLDTVAGCTLCLDLNADFLRRQWRRFGKLPSIDTRYGFTLKKLAENAGAGPCRGCQLLSTAVEMISKDVDLKFTNAQLEFCDDNPGIQGLCIRLTTLYPSYASQADWEKAQNQSNLTTDFVTGPSTRTPERPREWRISSPLYEIFHDDESSDPLGTAIRKRPQRCGNTGSDEAVAWAKSRLDECSSQHPACCSNCILEHPFLPTRVLDLGDLDYDGDLSQSPMLLLTQGDMRGEYACLSHCWGPPEAKPLESTTGTVGKYQTDGIPWSKLPKTFQEAIVFTRKLGIRYLWIDSLCIVQNDADDWFKEAGRMATTYENATLTIAAAASSSSQEGLYRTSMPSWRLDGRTCVRRCADPVFFEHQYTRNPDFLDRVAPLLRRAWVLQERLISRRLLHFTPLELVFECYSGNKTESGFCWVDSAAKHSLSELNKPETEGTGSSTPDLVSFMKMWRRLVEDFTHLQLTRNEDTLPAMAGLAKKTMALTAQSQDDYLAGLWRQTFVEDMMWQRRLSVRAIERINNNVPSWSWARDGKPKSFVTQGGQSLAQPCDLIEGVCAPDAISGDSFLGVQLGSHAVLSGYLLPARVTSLGIAIDKNPRMQYNPRKDFEWSSESSGRRPVLEGDRVFALPLVLHDSLEGVEGYGVDIHALVVRCSPGEQTYHRVGIFWTSLLHLGRQYDYVLEDNDFLVNALEQHITFGEKALENESSMGKLVAPNTSKDSDTITVSQYTNAAEYTLLCMYGRKGTRRRENVEGPHSQAYLEILKGLLRTEKDRRQDWTRRATMGIEQVCPRAVIKLE